MIKYHILSTLNTLNFFALANLSVKFSPLFFISPFIAQISENHLIFWYLLVTIFSFTTIADFGINAVSTRYLSFVRSGIRLKNIIRKETAAEINNGISTKELCLINLTINSVYNYVCVFYIFISFFILKIILNNEKFFYIENYELIAYVVLILSWLNLYLNRFVVLIQSFENIKLVYKIQFLSILLSVIVSFIFIVNSSFLLSVIAMFLWPAIAFIFFLKEVLKICRSVKIRFLDMFKSKKIGLRNF